MAARSVDACGRSAVRAGLPGGRHEGRIGAFAAGREFSGLEDEDEEQQHGGEGRQPGQPCRDQGGVERRGVQAGQRHAGRQAERRDRDQGGLVPQEDRQGGEVHQGDGRPRGRAAQPGAEPGQQQRGRPAPGQAEGGRRDGRRGLVGDRRARHADHRRRVARPRHERRRGRRAAEQQRPPGGAAGRLTPGPRGPQAVRHQPRRDHVRPAQPVRRRGTAAIAEIAEALVISVATVKAYVSRLLTKLDARDRVHLVIIAYEAGLVP